MGSDEKISHDSGSATLSALPAGPPKPTRGHRGLG